MGRLSARQRTSVVLVHGYGWSYQEVGDMLGIARSSVQQHVDRGDGGLLRHGVFLDHFIQRVNIGVFRVPLVAGPYQEGAASAK
ncbi:MAG: hypothetical protein IH793_02925 [Acidobacteria bacterium]|nr:hypothetical protein [Acidobacteriota bacterium]